MAASDVDTAMTAAQAALTSGDYATAIERAVAAQGYLAALPDSELSGVSSLRWDAAKIEHFVRNVRALRRSSQAATYGIQTTKITHARTSTSD